MAFYSRQEFICCMCGVISDTVDGLWDQAVCGSECLREKNWRETLHILGKDYRFDPRGKGIWIPKSSDA
jgi:hypothetical protein